MKLHLGCGERYLADYLNVDFPPRKHSVMRPRADLYADITMLHFKSACIEEIRCHHVFEHFDRAIALRVLINWYQWLIPNGRIIIETPDFERSARRILRGSFRERMVAARHLFGSHEADWAIHKDGWFESKFRLYLEALGFESLEFSHSEWQGTFNITVVGRKPVNRLLDESALFRAARELLSLNLVDESPSEQHLLNVWLEKLT